MSDSPHYAYIFVRQDISKEQQLIQFGHVSCVLGQRMPASVNSDYLHFVGIGVKDEIELYQVMGKMAKNSIDYVYFEEGHFNNSITAVASMPVSGVDREIFREYSLLKFLD